MTCIPSFRRVYTFLGWVIKELKLDPEIVLVTIRKNKRYALEYPKCSSRDLKENKRTWQTVRDLPLGIGKTVMIRYEAMQIRCRHCGTYSTILPPDIDHNAKATKRLMRCVSKMCRFMSANKVPAFIPISESTARRWDKKKLQEIVPDPGFDSLRGAPCG